MLTSCLSAGSSPGETCECNHIDDRGSNKTEPAIRHTVDIRMAWRAAAARRRQPRDCYVGLTNSRLTSISFRLGLPFSSRQIGLVLYPSCLLTLHAKPPFCHSEMVMTLDERRSALFALTKTRALRFGFPYPLLTLFATAKCRLHVEGRRLSPVGCPQAGPAPNKRLAASHPWSCDDEDLKDTASRLAHA